MLCQPLSSHQAPEEFRGLDVDSLYSCRFEDLDEFGSCLGDRLGALGGDGRIVGYL